jgi:sporulation protein YlmC with PRC-barrel domain
MTDPVSYLMIEPGWAVVGSDGKEIGSVSQVRADESKDIFDGLMVKAGMLGAARYVPAERVARIFEGRIELDVTGDALQQPVE